MASRNRKTRCREVTGVLLLFLFLSAKKAGGQEDETISVSEDAIQEREWAIMDRLVQAYGATDWSAVATFLVANPGSAGNPNIVFILLSLGNAYLNRFEGRHDIADFFPNPTCAAATIELLAQAALTYRLSGRPRRVSAQRP